MGVQREIDERAVEVAVEWLVRREIRADQRKGWHQENRIAPSLGG